MDFDWKSIVKTVAPAIGTALGGPMGGTAVRFLTEKLLGNPSAPESDLANALQSMSPEQLLQLKTLDQEFAKHMADLGVDLEKLAQADRSSARELAKTDNRPHMVLSGVYTWGYFWILWLFCSGAVHVPENQTALFASVVGVLTAAQIQIMNFWFGSSSGSREKTTHLANSSPLEATA